MTRQQIDAAADLVLESMPDGLIAALQVRNSWRAPLAEPGGPLEFVSPH